MLVNDQFKMRVSAEDRQIIRAVAEHFQRTQGDAVRLIVREVYAVIQEKEQQAPARASKQPVSRIA